MTMFQKISNVIGKEMFLNYKWNTETLAHAVLQIMQEPTEEMVTQQDDCEFQKTCHTCGGHVHGYKIMIKQALEKAK